MGIKTIITILASLTFSVSALADHHEGGEKKPFSIYGDFATSLNFQGNEAGNHDDFNIDLAELNLEKNWSKSKLHLSIGYGSTALLVNQLSTATSQGLSTNTINLMNAYYSMHTSYGLGFMIGKFESPVGHETYNHMDNSQFNRSFGFMLAPYFSTGLGVNYSHDMFTVGFIASNGSGRDTDPADKNKTLALVVDVDPMENLHIDLNYVTGKEGYATVPAAGTDNTTISTIDFSAAYMINEMVDVAVNYIGHSQDRNITGTDSASGSSIAAYVNANFGMFGLGLRYEQFTYDYALVMPNNATGAFSAVGTDLNPGNDNTISSITLSANAEIDQNAMFKLEYKMDSSDDKVWTDKDGVSDTAQSTLTAAVMYRF